MAAFTTLPLADRDFASPFNDAVIDALRARDEELRERPVYLEFSEIGPISVESYPGSPDKSWKLYVPPGGLVWRPAFQMHKHNAASAEAQFKIGGLTSSEVSTTNTAYADEPVFWCVFSDLSSVLDTEVTLDLYLKRTGSTGGSPHMEAREANGPASYFAGA